MSGWLRIYYTIFFTISSFHPFNLLSLNPSDVGEGMESNMDSSRVINQNQLNPRPKTFFVDSRVDEEFLLLLSQLQEESKIHGTIMVLTNFMAVFRVQSMTVKFWSIFDFDDDEKLFEERQLFEKNWKKSYIKSVKMAKVWYKMIQFTVI